MARSFEDVLKEVNKTSDPQRNTILKQVADIPRQTQAEEAGLKATQSQAFDEILGGARRRGLGFSGIPLGEQAQYTATQFLPAVARLKTSMNDRKTTLESALNDIGRTNYMTAQDIYGRDRAFSEDRRRFEIQQADARRSAAAQTNYASIIDQLQKQIQAFANGGVTNTGPAQNLEADRSGRAYAANLLKSKGLRPLYNSDALGGQSLAGLRLR